MDRTPKPGELYKHFKGKTYQVITTAVHSETGGLLVIYQAMYGDFCIYATPLAAFTSEVDDKKYPQAAQRYEFEKIEKKGQAAARNDSAGNASAAQNDSAGSASAAQNDSAGRTAVQNDGAGNAAAVHNVQPQSASQPVFDSQLQTQQAEVSAAHMPEQKPRTQSPAEAKRGLRMEEDEIPDTESDYFKKRRRQIEEREHRREQFRKPEKHESATDELRANPSLLKFLDTDTYEEKFQVLTDIRDDMTNRLIDDIAVVLDVVIPEGPLEDRYHQLRNIILTRQKYETSRFR